MIHPTEQRQPHSPRTPASAAPLTVAINAQINPNRGGGVESALLRLIEALHERPGSERYLLLSTEEFRDDVARLAGEHQRMVAWPFPQSGFPGARKREGLWRPAVRHSGPLRRYVDGVHRRLWEYETRHLRNPDAEESDSILRAHGAQVVHFPYAVPFGTDLPFVYEPWDLQHRHLPDFFHRGEVVWRDRVYGDACRNAAYVVVATHWTKQDIVKEFGVNPNRIVVISRGPGVGARSSDPETIARVRQARDLPEGFAFFPAMSFPHKNHVRLLEALAILRDRYNLVVPLVGTGRPYRQHWPYIVETLDRFKLRGQVQFFGMVSEEELNAMFALARFMVFPSLFEGLGLPVLEAQQLGVPVLSSTASCLPEVAGDGALYFDPADPEAIAAAIRRVYEEPELLPSLVERGAANLQRFSWPAAAATFAACYRSAAGLPLDDEQTTLLKAALTP
jgi:glycosyltransferase involved in cell wall biosynthesis